MLFNLERRLGLRFRMAASYVLVSAAAVLLVEAVLLAVAVPRLQKADDAAAQARTRAEQAENDVGRLKAEALASSLAATAGRSATDAATAMPGRTDAQLLAIAATNGFVNPSAADQRGVGPLDIDNGVVQVLAGVDGKAVASSPRNAYRAGVPLPPTARGETGQAGVQRDHDHVSFWASTPIVISVPGSGQRRIGTAYVTVGESSTAGSPHDADATAKGTVPGQGTGPGQGTDADNGPSTPASSSTSVASLVTPGIVALVLLLPVGALFGMLSTGRLIRRIRRLSEGTAAMAEGDLRARIPVSTGDEVGRLERAFNTMAERLEDAVAEQRRVAGAEARRAERGRIARELHDSISQDLFSVSMVAAGMRKATPPGSVLHEQATSMDRSLVRTMREMRALLLELRPVVLEDAGLAAAVEELCRIYEARLGVPITAQIDPVPLDPSTEHAVLRMVQEAVGNAIRHGDPAAIDVRLRALDGRIELTVRDDGRGFDPAAVGGRHGLGLELMRERAGEAGGTARIDSAPNLGTTVTVSLPAGEGVVPERIAQ